MGNIIVNLRGGGGSGKTTAYRKFLDYPHRVVLGPNLHTKAGKDEVKGYVVDATALGIQNPVFLVGSYETNCGGTDKIKKQQEIADRVIEWYRKGYTVIFEGLLVSKLGPGGTVTKALKEEAGDRAWFLFLDTPAEVCHERVLNRRKERGDHRPFDPNKSLFKDHKATWRCKSNLEETGYTSTAWIAWDGDTYQQVVNMIKWGERHYD